MNHKVVSIFSSFTQTRSPMMPEYTITQDNLHVVDSYQIPKSKFRRILVRIEGEHPESDVWKRSKCSMKLEWACHNAGYDLHFRRERTKDIDLNYPQKLWEKLFYTIAGLIVWAFID